MRKPWFLIIVVVLILDLAEGLCLVKDMLGSLLATGVGVI